MTTADVQLLLDSCDRSTRVGVRNFAIMTLVARLDLRSIEVARVRLRDVDWRSGDLSSGARRSAETGYRCRRRSAKPWWPTWRAIERGTAPSICS
jgi:integrase